MAEFNEKRFDIMIFIRYDQAKILFSRIIGRVSENKSTPSEDFIFVVIKWKQLDGGVFYDALKSVCILHGFQIVKQICFQKFFFSF